MEVLKVEAFEDIAESRHRAENQHRTEDQHMAVVQCMTEADGTALEHPFHYKLWHTEVVQDMAVGCGSRGLEHSWPMVASWGAEADPFSPE